MTAPTPVQANETTRQRSGTLARKAFEWRRFLKEEVSRLALPCQIGGQATDDEPVVEVDVWLTFGYYHLQNYVPFALKGSGVAMLLPVVCLRQDLGPCCPILFLVAPKALKAATGKPSPV